MEPTRPAGGAGVRAALVRALFGDSMLAIRLFPALAGAGLVLLIPANAGVQHAAVRS